MANKLGAEEKAKRYAFLLLRFRPRSEEELSYRLKRKGFPESTIKDTVAFLKEKNFLDDKIFARQWTASRLKKPYGVRKIVQELKLKGVNKKIIEEEIRWAKDVYPEQQTVEALAKVKLTQLKKTDPQTAKRKTYAYLLRRGFLPETVIDVLNQL